MTRLATRGVPKASDIIRRLLKLHPDARIALCFEDPLELLIATILSAQCTDARVNQVTESLFRKYRSAGDYANADPSRLEEEIRPTGFYRNKAKALMNCCRKLAEAFHGEVPSTLEALTTLPGVGRKTANIVLGAAFGQQAIAVDTHVLRVSNRLGLVATRDADGAEQALMAQVPADQWTPFTLAAILHGREVCTARKPKCLECGLYELCPWPEKTPRR
jgi:endonuclease-3